MEQSEINKLIYLSKENDEKAFAQIVYEFQDLIFSVAFRLLCNEDDAKDATQETFVKLWQNLNKYDSSKKFSTWLYTIVTNHCYDKLKRIKPERVDTSSLKEIVSSIDIEKDLTNKEIAQIIVLLADKLSPKQRILFTLHDIEALDIDEIVEITKFSKSQIKSNLHLARQTIKEKIKKIDL